MNGAFSNLHIIHQAASGLVPSEVMVDYLLALLRVQSTLLRSLFKFGLRSRSIRHVVFCTVWPSRLITFYPQSYVSRDTSLRSQCPQIAPSGLSSISIGLFAERLWHRPSFYTARRGTQIQDDMTPSLDWR